jgi:O-antigen ligase
MVFYIIPVFFLAMNPMLYDSATIFRGLLLTLFSSIYFLFNKIKFRKNLFVIVILGSLIGWYILGFFSNSQNYADFFLGGYSRGFGLLALIALFLVILIAENNVSTQDKILFNSLYITLVLAIIYGFFQSINIDFFQYVMNFNGIRLTLANPNFASAFLGIIGIVPIAFYFNNKSNKKYLHLLTFFVTVYLIFQTASSQGLVILLFSIILFFSFKIFPLIKKIRRSILLLSSTTLSAIVCLVFFSYSKIITKYLEESFQVSARLEHWLVALKVFESYPLFGVGIDNLGKYSGEFVSSEFVKRTQGYTYPDKSHNTLLDHYANGGFIAGTLWLIFIIYISIWAIKIQASSTSGIEKWKVHLISSIWYAYLLQTFINTDHLMIALIGFIAAGCILGVKNRLKAPV